MEDYVNNYGIVLLLLMVSNITPYIYNLFSNLQSLCKYPYNEEIDNDYKDYIQESDILNQNRMKCLEKRLYETLDKLQIESNEYRNRIHSIEERLNIHCSMILQLINSHQKKEQPPKPKI